MCEHGVIYTMHHPLPTPLPSPSHNPSSSSQSLYGVVPHNIWYIILFLFLLKGISDVSFGGMDGN